eukprot:superscaffoldBa00001853_g12267
MHHCIIFKKRGFLIPYFIMLFLEGVPLFYMELAIGQKMRLGSIRAWTAISPYLGGVGLASVVTSLYLCLYYNIINAWSFWYLFHSFQSVLPWAECPINSNRTAPIEECQRATPTQYFFYRETLDISSSIEENGGIHTGQALCLLLAWVITYLFIVRGVKSTGKVVYFTATFPYVVLFIYLIRGVTLHGAINGVKYMFTPKAVEGTGLAFIVYSEAIKNMPLSQLWSVLYFFMLLLLGMGSMLGNITAIITPLRDFKVISRMSNEMFNGLVCLFCLLLGLGFTTTSGNYWFTMFNDYGATFSLLFIVLIEVITVSYIYGIKRFEKDIEDMLGHRPHWYWKIMWTGVSPLLLIALFIFYIINYIQGGTPTYQAWNKELGKSVVTEYPVFGQVFIGLLLVSSVSCVPLTALSVYCRKRKHGHHKRQRTVSTVSA